MQEEKGGWQCFIKEITRPDAFRRRKLGFERLRYAPSRAGNFPPRRKMWAKEKMAVQALSHGGGVVHHGNI